jgi:hypothetical protein
MCASGELLNSQIEIAEMIAEMRDTPLLDISEHLDKIELTLSRGLAKLAAEADA